MEPIHSLGIAEIPDLAKPKETASPGRVFADVLQEAHQAEKVANEASLQLANGDPKAGLHEVMIAVEKANIQIRFAVTLKNRMIEAYRELMNTQL